MSGRTLNRLKIKMIIQMIHSKKVNSVVVYKLDRLSRNITDLIYFLNVCTENNVNFISITEQIDLSTALGRMFIYIIGLLGQFESEQISERTMTGLQQKASQGLYPFGAVPYGYDLLEDGTLKVNEHEKEKLLEAFDLYVYEFKSAKYLDNCGKFNEFRAIDLVRKLDNTIYQGYIEIPKKSGNRFDICEPIISEQQLHDLKYRKKHNKKHYGYKHIYKFRNKIRINGKPARHQKKHKNGKEYNYYYIKNLPYVNEKYIEEFIEAKYKEEKRINEQKYENKIQDLAYELSIKSITKEEFDIKYNEIRGKIENYELNYSYIDITISRNKEKRKIKLK